MTTEKKKKLIATRIRLARESAGLTQAQAAKKLNVARPTLTECEAGRRNVTAAEIAEMAEIYGVGVTWLLGDEEDVADPEQDRIALAAREIAGLKERDLANVLQLVRSIRAKGKLQ